MGIAILWVMAYHLVSKGKSFYDFSIFSPIMGLGYGGVDIFLFLSGIGLYFSYSKCPKYKNFIKNRIIRIMPAYIVVNIVYGIVTGLTMKTILLNILTIGFWNQSSYYDWYVPSILLLYVLFPLFFLIISIKQKQHIKINIILTQPIIVLSFIVVTMLITTLYITTNSELDDIRMFFVARIPIFLLGTVFGDIVKNRLSISLKPYTIIMLLGLVLLYWLKNQDLITIHLGSGILQLPFLLITPGLCLLLCLLLDHIPHKVVSFLTFIGSISLELYIIHLHIFESTPFYNGNKLQLYLVILIPIIFILSYALNKICIMIHHVLMKKL